MFDSERGVFLRDTHKKQKGAERYARAQKQRDKAHNRATSPAWDAKYGGLSPRAIKRKIRLEHTPLQKKGGPFDRVWDVCIENAVLSVEADTLGAAARIAFRACLKWGYIERQPRSLLGGWEGVGIEYSLGVRPYVMQRVIEKPHARYGISMKAAGRHGRCITKASQSGVVKKSPMTGASHAQAA